MDAVPLPVGPDEGELLEALAALGYSAVEAQMAVRALPKDDSLTQEDRLRLALAELAPQSD